VVLLTGLGVGSVVTVFTVADHLFDGFPHQGRAPAVDHHISVVEILDVHDVTRALDNSA
jgi:hypothetical protein